MQYALLYYETPQESAKRGSASDAEGYWASWTRYMEMLSSSGALQGGHPLEVPHTKTLVRHADGHRVIEDGPFPETHDELGGFVIVDANDLDAAVQLAEQAPCARAGHVEVRPVLQRNA